MHTIRKSAAIAFIACATSTPPALAQERPDPAAMLAAQKDAMSTLAFMDGVWRGPAFTVLPSGERHTIVQTERIGPFLGGTVKVLEGRGYDNDGRVSFNALGIISWSGASRTYSMRSYAQGFAGDFVVKPTPDGFTWDIPLGSTTIRYNATVKNGEWLEVGDRLVPDREPVRFFEMRLKRIGDTAWPEAGAVSAK